MQPNDRQIGGDHYQSGYQHWDFVLSTGAGYLVGNATKYVSRWRKAKNGVQDLHKALHYVEKLITAYRAHEWEPSMLGTAFQAAKYEQVVRFVAINRLGELEGEVVERLICCVTSRDLVLAYDAIKQLIAKAEGKAEADVPEADPVPLTEENHYAERSVPRFPPKEDPPDEAR